jgi:hypothetical protein
MMNGRGRRYPEPIRARNGRAGPGPASGSTETVGRGDGTAVSVRVAVTRHSRCRQAAGFRGADSARVISAEQHTGIRCRGCGSAPSSPAALSFSATPLVAAIDVRRDLTDRAMCEPRPGQQKSEGDGYMCTHGTGSLHSSAHTVLAKTLRTTILLPDDWRDPTRPRAPATYIIAYGKNEPRYSNMRVTGTRRPC